MVPGYARHPKQQAKALEYQRQNEEIVLVEGVPALHDSLDALPWTCSIGLKESKDELEKRVHALYAWKGYLEEERLALWEKEKQPSTVKLQLWFKSRFCIYAPSRTLRPGHDYHTNTL